VNQMKILISICIVLLPTLCQAANDGYGYPIPGSYAATILGTPPPLKPSLPEKINSKRLVLDVIPGVKRPDIFFYNNGLRCTFAYQDKKAPMVFLIAGTGSNDQSTKLTTMMKALYQAGFHVVTLPSPTHPNFIVNASHSHVPGDLTEDAADLYSVMENVWNRVKEDIEVSEFYLGGFSLGATQAAFVAKLDDEKKSFNFSRVLMINPAVSLYDSVSRIEGLLDRIPGGSRKIGVFFNKTLNKFVEFYREGDFIDINNEFLYAVAKSNLVDENEQAGIIGLAFRIASAGMIFSSDVMTNGGYVVPKNRVLANSDPLDDYFRVSIHTSFLDYFNQYFYPYFQKKRPGLTKEALIASLSLKSIEPYLKSSRKIGVITNENDFILSNDDRNYLRQLFGERAKIYPLGGHGGNFEYIVDIAYALDFFKQSGGRQ